MMKPTRRQRIRALRNEIKRMKKALQRTGQGEIHFQSTRQQLIKDLRYICNQQEEDDVA